MIAVQAGTVDGSYAKNLKEKGEIKDYVLFRNQLALLNEVDSGKIVTRMSDALTFSDLIKNIASNIIKM
ncbi:MAG: hypothetical protein ACRDDM_12110 [Paraclostridium sp.]